ncbi:hypothetical protein Vretifemale_11450, partial [Volvox reticuliferus]
MSHVPQAHRYATASARLALQLYLITTTCIISALATSQYQLDVPVFPASLLQLPTCRSSSEPAPGSVTCTVNSNIKLQSGSGVVWPRHVALIGDGLCPNIDDTSPQTSIGASPPNSFTLGGWNNNSINSNNTVGTTLGSVLNLAALSDIFTLPVNGTLELRGLCITGALLSASTYPFPLSSFLALSALNLTLAIPQPPESPIIQQAPPPLILSDLIISTPSCRALLLHQAFACAASPSPNFTVTPTALIVHRYSTSTALIVNVTLTCSGQPQPSPCAALHAATGTELLQAIKMLEGFAKDTSPLGSMSTLSTFVFLERDIKFVSAVGAAAASVMAEPPPPAVPIPSTQIATDPQPAVPYQYSSPRGPAIAMSQQDPQLTVNYATIIIAGAPGGATVLDLSNSAGVVAIKGAGAVHLHNLTLRNLPVGTPSTYALGMFRMGMWTFTFSRRLLGRRGQAYLLLQDVDVLGLPLEELAAYWYDRARTGNQAVPPRLAPCQCIYMQNLLYGTAYWFEDAVPYLEANILNSVGDGLVLERVRMYAVAASNTTTTTNSASTETPSSSLSPFQSEGGDVETPTIAPTTAAAATATPNCMAGGLCALVPERPPQRPWILRASATGQSASIRFFDAVSRDNAAPLSLVLSTAYSILEPSVDSQLKQAFVFTGDPFSTSVLNLLAIAPVLCIDSSGGSATLRNVVFMGLAPFRTGQCGLQPRPPPRRPWMPSRPPPTPPTRPDQPTPPPVALTEVMGPGLGAHAPAPPQPAPVGPIARGGSYMPLTHRLLQASTSSSGGGSSTSNRTTAPPNPAPPVDVGQPRGCPVQQQSAWGLDPALSNFTSCFWGMNFDRHAAVAGDRNISPAAAAAAGAVQDAGSAATVKGNVSGGGGAPLGGGPFGLPYVFLDSVTLVIPQPELDVLIWSWATNSTVMATEPGLADQLGRMLAGSSLAAESVLAVAKVAIDYRNAAVGSSTEGFQVAAPRSLIFMRFWWCGLEGRNVTLTSQLPLVAMPYLSPAREANSERLSLPVTYLSSPAPNPVPVSKGLISTASPPGVGWPETLAAAPHSPELGAGSPGGQQQQQGQPPEADRGHASGMQMW